MRHRTPIQWIIRGIVAAGVFMTPLIADHIPVPLIPIALGAVLAYDELTSGRVWLTGGYVVCFEMVWGMHLGMLLLPYLGAALLLGASRRVFTVPLLSRERAWPPLSVVMTAFVAFGLSWVIARSLLPVTALVASLLFVIGLHRIDVPFRRALIFNAS